MRRHNKKGNGFYKIAKTTPKYVSIDAVLVKVARDYLRKIAEAPASVASTPNTQNAPPLATESSVPQSGGTSSGSEESLAAGTLPSGQQVGQLPGSVGQETTSQLAGESLAPGDAGPVQSGATGVEKKTDVMGAPSKKEPPNYLKNLALLIGVPLTIASLAGGAIRGFGMSSLIGLGLGAVATVYGFGFLDSTLHPKNVLPAEIEHLKRREAVKYFQQPENAEWTVKTVFGARPLLSNLPRDYSTGSAPPDEFKRLYELSQDYIMELYSKSGLPPDSLPKIFGYSSIGAPPDTDMMNSLNKGRDLERHATIIALANVLKKVEKHENGNVDKAVILLRDLVHKVPYWYTFVTSRRYLADPITFAYALDQVSRDLYVNYGIRAHLIKKKPLVEHFMEVASYFDSDNQKAQPQ
jgi:hypothetical protein